MFLDFFDETKEDQLLREVQFLRKEIGNVRRGLFARHSKLAKMYTELSLEFEALKKSIAKQERDTTVWMLKSSNSIRPLRTLQDAQERSMFIS